jgi:uncharacterized phiE125 gp8 family phage protein
MATVQTSAPAVEPITLEEAKAHLRLDTNDDDMLIQSLILTSRLHIEVALGLALITQTWSCFFDRWPARAGALVEPAGGGFTLRERSARFEPASETVTLPISPVRSIDAVRIYAGDGTFISLPTAGFTFDLASRHPRVTRNAETMMPEPGRRLNGVEIAVTCGFGPSPADVPAPIRQALLLLVAHWYEHRDPGEIGTPEARIPASVASLLSNYLPVRL